MQRGPACCSGTVFRAFLQRAPGKQVCWRALDGQNQCSWSFAVTVPPAFVQTKCNKAKGYFLCAEALFSHCSPAAALRRVHVTGTLSLMQMKPPAPNSELGLNFTYKASLTVISHPCASAWGPSNVLLGPATVLRGRKRLLYETPGKGGLG